LRTWVCGEHVTIRTELRRAATERALGDKGAPGWSLRQKHIVRGHWKLQRSGEGGRERKRIFVEPYWRGPDGTEAWERVYDTTKATAR
jgi:hypothetical protein